MEGAYARRTCYVDLICASMAFLYLSMILPKHCYTNTHICGIIYAAVYIVLIVIISVHMRICICCIYAVSGRPIKQYLHDTKIYIQYKLTLAVLFVYTHSQKTRAYIVQVNDICTYIWYT